MTELTILNLSLGDGGHRGQYLAMLASLFESEATKSVRRAVTSRYPVLVPFIEESLAKYAVTCVTRSFLGRRTAGFLFRPKPTLEAASVRMWVKRSVLSLLRHLPGVATLTILPFAVEPEFSRIANDWVYDLQLWDIAVLGDGCAGTKSELAARIRNTAGDRQVCVAIGRQDVAKGFDLFARSWIEGPALCGAMLFGFGGEVDRRLGSLAGRFAELGGFAIDRMISDDELLDFYAAADLVWCVYAPDYDQASGILGRATQFGLPVVVREGSFLERLCQNEGYPHLAVADLLGEPALHNLPAPIDRETALAAARARGVRSLATLRRVLGLA